MVAPVAKRKFINLVSLSYFLYTSFLRGLLHFLSMEFEISELAKAVGFNVISKDRNPAWKPINDKFANDILEELKIYKPNARITAVHAGLECGVLLEKKAGLSACSIGPNIYSPHSTREHCEVASALFIEKVVRGIVKKYNS